jgi:hypothetical protein
VQFFDIRRRQEGLWRDMSAFDDAMADTVRCSQEGCGGQGVTQKSKIAKRTQVRGSKLHVDVIESQ